MSSGLVSKVSVSEFIRSIKDIDGEALTDEQTELLEKVCKILDSGVETEYDTDLVKRMLEKGSRSIEENGVRYTVVPLAVAKYAVVTGGRG